MRVEGRLRNLEDAAGVDASTVEDLEIVHRLVQPDGSFVAMSEAEWQAYKHDHPDLEFIGVRELVEEED